MEKDYSTNIFLTKEVKIAFENTIKDYNLKQNDEYFSKRNIVLGFKEQKQTFEKELNEKQKQNKQITNTKNHHDLIFINEMIKALNMLINIVQKDIEDNSNKIILSPSRLTNLIDKINSTKEELNNLRDTSFKYEIVKNRLEDMEDILTYNKKLIL